MPIYEFKCQKCGHVMEILERSSGNRKHICERCKSEDLQKLPSGFSVGHADGSLSGGGGSCPTGTCSAH
ncbi:MAG: zinc ribbon domain-containing protein [Sedimentisphaerales bacterium]|nr:zinc ribbon domain-containing protein [Sedimentisphaerales bacterium]